jgi:hypothetical protein
MLWVDLLHSRFLFKFSPLFPDSFSTVPLIKIS